MALVIETEKYRLKEYQSVEIIVMKEKAKDEENLHDLYEKLEEE